MRLYYIIYCIIGIILYYVVNVLCRCNVERLNIGSLYYINQVLIGDASHSILVYDEGQTDPCTTIENYIRESIEKGDMNHRIVVGYLKKSPATCCLWKSRTFVIIGNTLQYFEKGKFEAGGIAKGTISLSPDTRIWKGRSWGGAGEEMPPSELTSEELQYLSIRSGDRVYELWQDPSNREHTDINRAYTTLRKFLDISIEPSMPTCASLVQQDASQMLVDVAKSWICKGEYVKESDSIIVSNYPSWPPYIVSDFNIIFIYFNKLAEYKEGQFNDIVGICRRKYETKTLTFNCWQLILLCLLESGLISEEDIRIVYSNVMAFNNSPAIKAAIRQGFSGDNKRIPDYFPVYIEYLDMSRDKMPNIGDIILHYNRNRLITHVSIYIGESQEESIIEIDVSGSVRHNTFPSIDGIFTTNLGYCKPSEVVRSIKSLSLMEITNLEDDQDDMLDKTLEKYIEDNS